MLSLKGLPHCKPSATVREWVQAFEEAVKRGLVKFEGSTATFVEHTHTDLVDAIKAVEAKVGNTVHTHPELLKEISNLRGMIMDIKDTVDKIKAL